MAHTGPYLKLVTTLVMMSMSAAQYVINQPSVPFPLGGSGGGTGSGGGDGSGNFVTGGGGGGSGNFVTGGGGSGNFVTGGGGGVDTGSLATGGGGTGGGGVAKDPIEHLMASIPGGGIPGSDYPILAAIPDTGFSCQGQIPGYYADTNREARCQVFHICQTLGRMNSFLCPNGTIFNQQYFICDWWYSFDCSTAEQYYELNALIGQENGSSGQGNGGDVGSSSTAFGSREQGDIVDNINGNIFGNSNVNGGSPDGGNVGGNNRGTPSALYSTPGGGTASSPSGLYQSPRA